MTGTDDSWQLWMWRDYVFQAGVAPNLVNDGGFEGVVLPHAGIPPQLPFILGGTVRHSALVYAQPDSGQNMMLLLNGRGETSVGLSTQAIPLPLDTPGDAYLLAGRYRSGETAVPLIGIRWLLKDA